MNFRDFAQTFSRDPRCGPSGPVRAIRTASRCPHRLGPSDASFRHRLTERGTLIPPDRDFEPGPDRLAIRTCGIEDDFLSFADDD